MTIVFADLRPGETPIDDITGLKVSGISTRKELSFFEAANIRKPMVKYCRRGVGPSVPVAPRWHRGNGQCRRGGTITRGTDESARSDELAEKGKASILALCHRRKGILDEG